jgi:hypothetical protein
VDYGKANMSYTRPTSTRTVVAGSTSLSASDVDRLAAAMRQSRALYGDVHLNPRRRLAGETEEFPDSGPQQSGSGCANLVRPR